MPVGAVVAFAGYVGPPVSAPPYTPDYEVNSPPDGFCTDNVEGYGWMVCDGRSLYCRDYPELFRALGFLYSHPGDTYGPQATYDADTLNSLPDDSTFRVPDYRGYFLRMVYGSQTAPATENRYLPFDPDTANSGIGSIQQDALQTHQHEYKLVNVTSVAGSNGGSAVMPPPQYNELTSTPTDQLGQTPGKVRVADETRPQNMFIYYLIKYV